MKTLPPKKQIPQCFVTLGFDNIPSMDELKNRFHMLAKESHPDSGAILNYSVCINPLMKKQKSI